MEQERTGIKSLKVGYNKVFGYYIEVSNAHRRRVPLDYHRKQTLVGAERYFTPELKDWETTVLQAQEGLLDLETRLVQQVCAQIASAGEELLTAAAAIASLDCLAALAEAAVRYGYVRPQLDCDDTVQIEGGRHRWWSGRWKIPASSPTTPNSLARTPRFSSSPALICPASLPTCGR